MDANRSVASGVPGLDEVLGGGFPAGWIYLFRGDSGTGKTTIGLQFLLEGIRAGEAVLYLSMAETESELRALAHSNGWSLDGVHLHHHSPTGLGDQQSMFLPSQIELPRLTESLLAVIEDVAPSRLVIDSLSELRLVAGEEIWYRRELVDLKRRIIARGITTLFTELVSGSHRDQADSVVNGVVELETVTPAYGRDQRRLRARKIATHAPVSGYHDYAIRRGGLKVFPRLIALDHRLPAERTAVGSGVPGLDALLGGGLSRGNAVLLLGPSGAGKSLLTLQMLCAAAQSDEPSVLFAFDERSHSLLARADSIGLPLRALVDEGRVRLAEVGLGELTSGEFSQRVRAEVEAGASLIAIDSLNGYAYSMPSRELLDVYLHELTTYLSNQRVTSLFTMGQSGTGGAPHVAQPLNILENSDVVLSFHYLARRRGLVKCLTVHKQRYRAHETAMHELVVSAQGVRVGERLDVAFAPPGTPVLREVGAATAVDTGT